MTAAPPPSAKTPPAETLPAETLPAEALPAEALSATAARVWSALQAFVAAQDRRQELRDALDIGRGLGRVTALLALTRGPMTLRDIAEANGVDAPYATVIVDKLEGRGLVRRTAHPDDNRRKLVILTDAGRDAAGLAARILAEPPAALAALAPGDLACLEEILARLGPAAGGSASLAEAR